MTTTRDSETILQEVGDLLRSAPQGSLDPVLVAERVGEGLRLLADRDIVWIDAEEAKQLLGRASIAAIPALGASWPLARPHRAGGWVD